MRQLILLALASALFGCQKDPVENLAAPTILGFYHEADTVGAVVHILGTQFSRTAKNNVVSFQGQDAPAFAVRGDTLQMRVPPGAKSGVLTVRVYAQSATSAQPFTVVTGRWRRRADVPVSLDTPVAFALGAKGYVSTGGNQGSQDLWAYDPALDRWQQKADFPGAPRRYALGFAIGTRGYVGFGRQDYLPYFGDFYAYDASSNRWTPQAGLAPADVEAEDYVAFAANGKGYLFPAAADKAAIIEYDPTTNRWTPKQRFPSTRRYLAVGFAIGPKGYVAGGTDGGGKLADSFWEYDPAADAWTQKAPVPQYGERGMAFAVGNKGYFGLNYSRRIYEYDPAQNTWSRKADFPSSVYYGARSFVLNGKGYVVSGLAYSSGSRELWEFTP